MKEEFLIKGPLAALITFGSYMLNVVNEILIVLLAVQGLDYLTGILKGFKFKTLNSTVGLNGLFKKMTMLIVVGLSACVEFVLLELGMNTNNVLVVGVISFFIVNEGLSVLENSAQLGVPIPGLLVNALEKLRDFTGEEKDKSKNK